MRNCFVGYRGGSLSRAGTAFVGRSKQNPAAGAPSPRLVPFNFNISQNYVCEFGNNYIRFVANGGFVVEGGKAITGATRANPCQITAVAHGYSNGDWVDILGVGGMTQLNGNTYIVAGVAANTFTITDLDGNPINSTGYGVYTAGGLAERIYTISSPYSGSDLSVLKWSQFADVLTVTHPSYPPYNLARAGPLSWSMTAVPFASTVSPPASASLSATVQPSGTLLPAAYAFVVTTVDQETGEESQPSAIANVTNSVDIASTAGSLIVSWATVTGNVTYNIYKAPTSYNTNPGDTANAFPVPVGSLFGLVGSSFGNQFIDSNLTPNFSQTPPMHKNPLAPGQVLSVEVTASSADWTTATVAITTATGTGFVGQVVIEGGAIIAVIVVNPGEKYISTDTVTFTGDGTSATATPAIGPASGTYPSLVSYFQQRKVYANSLNSPDTYWMSRPGQFNNFDISIPVSDGDAITGTPSSGKVDGIEWMVEMPLGLITFTGSSIEQVQASSSSIFAPAAITPTSQQALPQSSIGSSSNLAPVRDNWDILYFEPDNATLRNLTYQLYFNLYTGVDITWQSSHLTLGHQIVDRAWCRKPNYLLWMARDDGLFLSTTFLKEQEIDGWAKHTTQGQVRALCANTELPVDALYLSVQRSVLGSSHYYIERMDNRLWQSTEDPWCVDCGVATELLTPAATLVAFPASGNGATFISNPGVFAPSNVGQVVRMGNGIAVMTAYTSPTQMTGNWVYPCQQLIPDDPDNTPFPQNSGFWSIAGQVSKVGGLNHLIGKQVVGLADGVPVGPFIVAADGSVTLPFEASNIKIGLAFTAQTQSVYLDTGPPTTQGRRKSINAVTVRVEASAAMQAAANEIDASAVSPPPLVVVWTGMKTMPASPAQLGATYTSPGGQAVQPLFTGDIRIPIPSDWKKPGQVAVQQTLPVPLNILAFVPEVLGGDLPEESYSPRSQQQPQAGNASRSGASRS